jgi:hypothetical protein
MEHRQPDDPAYPRDLFAGTAPYYTRHRPGHPAAIIERVLLASGPRRRPRALDLCRGSGQAALALAPHFDSVLAVDQETELAITPDSLDLIAISNALHRVHRVVVARRAARWLRPGGVSVDTGSDGVLTGPEPWHAVISEVIRRRRPAREAPVLAGPWRTGEEALTEAGLVMVAGRGIPVPRRRTLDELVGHAFSTCGASPAAMGPAAPNFEAELRRSLLQIDPAGTCAESTADCFRIARREGR